MEGVGEIVGSTLAKEILGGAIRYVGANFKKYLTSSGEENLQQILTSAHNKLEELGKTARGVNPKLLKTILIDGALCEDRLTAEYFGGVLASGQGGIGRDDRAATWAALVAQLTCYQIRAHCVFYKIFKALFDGRPEIAHGLTIHDNYVDARIFVTCESYDSAMGFGSEELDLVAGITQDTLFGLKQHDLLRKVMVGDRDTLLEVTRAKGIDQAGFVFEPTVRGIQLFLWAHGCGDRQIVEFLIASNQYEADIDIEPLDGRIIQLRSTA